MPGNMLSLDTGFPWMTGKESEEERLTKITDYLFMLLESLRYTLGNLGEDNFNETELKVIGETISEPIYVRIKDAEGNISTLTQTANGLTTRVGNTEKNYTALSQTVNSFKLGVTNGENSSTITLNANGAAISSEIIKFTGAVTFSDLKTQGKTEIHAGNIKTGTVSAITLKGCTVEGSTFLSTLGADGTIGGEMKMCYLSTGSVAGGIRLDNQGAGSDIERQYRLFIYTNTVQGEAFCMKLQSAGGMSLMSDEVIYVEAATKLMLYAEDEVRISAEKIYLTGQLYFNGVQQ